MTKQEFVNKVSEVLQTKYKYTAKKVNDYFKTADAKEVLEDDYNHLTDKNIAVSPEATASTLDLMY